MASNTAGINRPRRTSLRLLVMFFSSVLLLGGFQAAAQAAPNQAPAVPDINYEFSQSNDKAILAFENAEVAVNNGNLEVKDLAGNLALSYPLSYDLGDLRFPIDASVDGGTATLTPVTNKARATALTPEQIAENARVNAYATRQERDDAALSRFNTELAAATAAGTLVGTIVGAVLGGIVGAIVGGGAACATVIGCPIGLLAGITVGAAVGGIIGTIAVGGPGLIISGVRYLETVNSPFRPS